jgi:hypothetical protein
MPVFRVIALIMETANTSETSVNFYQLTRRYNPEKVISILSAVRTSYLKSSLLIFRFPLAQQLYILTLPIKS